ncbi:glycoside hydrolase family 32 protein [Aquirufa rosea]|nr:glycoside hydrolase family 32 protein [Aquirufa rosea]
MKIHFKNILLASLFQVAFLLISQAQTATDAWRPLVHFSPQKNWTNDPNGLIYFKGYYHIFFQHNPIANEWGNMSWGHARSKDLLHWEELPLAIPHGEEYIFSGCVVWDKEHVSGLGDPQKELLVAIYTADYPNKKQEQHLAYSNDDGLTWTKYLHNPILDINLLNFRDPSVIWHNSSKQFVMSVAKPTERSVQFYGSKNLLNWELLSEFSNQGELDMIWECPSLAELLVEGSEKETKWVLFNSTQGVQKGFVGMQYFVGEFNGKTFTNANPPETKLFVDYGKDFYAAIPFYNAPNQEVLWLGWALSWQYAKEQPTFPWKGQMSSIRKLSLINSPDGLRLKQEFRPNFSEVEPTFQIKDVSITKSKVLSGIKLLQNKSYIIELDVEGTTSDRWGLKWQSADNLQEFTVVGFDEIKKQWFIDRSKSGKILSPGFFKIDSAPWHEGESRQLRVWVDHSMLELLAQDGIVAISSLRFPLGKKENLSVFSDKGKLDLKQIRIWELK